MRVKDMFENLKALYREIPKKIFVSEKDYADVCDTISTIYFLSSVYVEIDKTLEENQIVFEWYDSTQSGIEFLHGNIDKFMENYGK